MAEVFSFPAVTIRAFSAGQMLPPAVPFLGSVSLRVNREWESRQLVDGSYAAILRGQRADATFSLAWYNGDPLWDLLQTPVPVSLQFEGETDDGTERLTLKSGYILGLAYQGQDGDYVRQSIDYFTNEWERSSA